jgi:hypothetical protein
LVECYGQIADLVARLHFGAVAEIAAGKHERIALQLPQWPDDASR